MTPAMPDRDRLASAVRNAFSGVARPRSEAELGAALDPGWPRTLQTFLRKNWDEVRLGDLLWHRGDPLHEFNDDAFVYYLQTYLRALLTAPQRFGSLSEDVAWQFSPERDAGRRHVRLLSSDQRHAVADVLAACGKDENDDCAFAILLLRGELNDGIDSSSR